jgi:hypothetical protein
LGSHFKGEGNCKKNEIAFPLPPILKREVGREEKKIPSIPKEWVPCPPILEERKVAILFYFNLPF